MVQKRSLCAIVEDFRKIGLDIKTLISLRAANPRYGPAPWVSLPQYRLTMADISIFEVFLGTSMLYQRSVHRRV